MKIQIIVATGNDNKVREIREILQAAPARAASLSDSSNKDAADFREMGNKDTPDFSTINNKNTPDFSTINNNNTPDFIIMSMKQLGIHSDPEENGSTFEENALIKARACADEIERQHSLFKKAVQDLKVSPYSESAPSQLSVLTSFRESREASSLRGKNDLVKEGNICPDYLNPNVPVVVLADDSGLVVDALGGAPGIYSARYMGRDTSYTLKMQHIMDELDRLGAEGPARSARFVCACAAVFPIIPDLQVSSSARIATIESPRSDNNNLQKGKQNAVQESGAADQAKKPSQFTCASQKDDSVPLKTVSKQAGPARKEIVVTGTMEGEIGHEIRGANGFGYDPFFFLPEYGKTSAELTEEEKNAISHRGKAFRAMMQELTKIV